MSPEERALILNKVLGIPLSSINPAASVGSYLGPGQTPWPGSLGNIDTGLRTAQQTAQQKLEELSPGQENWLQKSILGSLIPGSLAEGASFLGPYLPGAGAGGSALAMASISRPQFFRSVIGALKKGGRWNPYSKGLMKELEAMRPAGSLEHLDELIYLPRDVLQEIRTPGQVQPGTIMAGMYQQDLGDLYLRLEKTKRGKEIWHEYIAPQIKVDDVEGMKAAIVAEPVGPVYNTLPKGMGKGTPSEAWLNTLYHEANVHNFQDLMGYLATYSENPRLRAWAETQAKLVPAATISKYRGKYMPGRKRLSPALEETDVKWKKKSEKALAAARRSAQEKLAGAPGGEETLARILGEYKAKFGF